MTRNAHGFAPANEAVESNELANQDNYFRSTACICYDKRDPEHRYSDQGPDTRAIIRPLIRASEYDNEADEASYPNPLPLGSCCLDADAKPR